MRHAPWSRRLFRSAGPLIVAGALFSASGCDYLDTSGVDQPPSASATPATGLGALCPIAVDTHTPIYYTLATSSTTCPSHICIIPPHQKTTDTTALCSLECQTDADCRGGEARNPQDPTDTRCQSGFSCQDPLPPLGDDSRPVPCHKMCACNDFFDPAHPPFTCS